MITKDQIGVVKRDLAQFLSEIENLDKSLHPGGVIIDDLFHRVVTCRLKDLIAVAENIEGVGAGMPF